MDIEPITEMTENDAWAFLAEHSFGRLALVVAGQPEIFPINYTVSDARVVFRTAEGTKLIGVVIDSRVAFEVDEVLGDGATSVVVKGVARRVETQSEEDALDLSGLVPWVPTLKYNVVVVDLTEISGRQFAFGAEPERHPGI